MSSEMSYWEGVEKARAQGLIEGEPGKRFKRLYELYSHKSGLNDCNSRVLNPIISKLLRALSVKNDALRILEMGPGAGVAVSQMRHIINDAVIHTMAGATPINPYWQFAEGILDDVTDSYFGDVAAALYRYLSRKKIESSGSFDMSKLTPDNIMFLQTQLERRVFDVVELPYVDYQWCGDFPDENPLKKKSYDFIYENCGPNYHIGGKTNIDVRGRTMELLAEGGMAVLLDVPMKEYNLDGSYVHFSTLNVDFLAHPDNEIAKRMAKLPYGVTRFGIENNFQNVLDDMIAEKAA
ncbi:hypothetical protein M0P48_04220 [Candidatus Gracilibacteria bacterium]|jgi:hypothetical protein|nr:hypothetical protein [Candidatus Gracilibacteria bacterium]